MMKQLPIGIQSFIKLIKRDYLYVDKTELIKSIIETIPYCFLSRPRRFGKSLILSTIKEIFAGNRELFKDLYIYDKIQWTPYPIIHIDMLGFGSQTEMELRNNLSAHLDDIARDFKIPIDTNRDCASKLKLLIKELYVKHKREVVILIDEYDKPILDHLENSIVAEKNRDFLRNFYSVLKSSDEFIHFVFITGVSKFTRTSIFSNLNNLTDISLQSEYATLAGYTQEELEYYFAQYIEDSSLKLKISKEECLDKIKSWYNGYSWDGVRSVYNPFSILNFFHNGDFYNYWYETGTPTFLVKRIKDKAVYLPSFEKIKTNKNAFETWDIDNIEITSMLFQAGYLTIKEKLPISENSDEHMFILSYPNKEVTKSFLEHLYKDYTGNDISQNLTRLLRLKTAIQNDKMEDFFIEIRSLFASIPYNIFISDKEAYYHTIIYLTLRLADITILSEIETNIGRIDALIETSEFIYILEFKIGTSEDAMNQIKEKSYYESFISTGKKILLIGIGFNEEERNISEPVLDYFENVK